MSTHFMSGKEASGSTYGASRSRTSAVGVKRSEDATITRFTRTSRVGLWLPVSMSVRDWSKVGVYLSDLHDSSSWWLGDWLIYGRKKFPDRYKRAIEETSLDYQTLRNYAWVSRKFPVTRRRPRLSFQHHAEVASLTIEDQDAWMDKAEKLKWSVHELRRRLRDPDRAGEQDGRGVSTVKLVIPGDQRDRWAAAAKSSGAELNSWMLSMLDKAAEGALSNGDHAGE